MSQSYPQLCSRQPAATTISHLLPSMRDHTDLPLQTTFPQPFAYSQPQIPTGISWELTGHSGQGSKKDNFRLSPYCPLWQIWYSSFTPNSTVDNLCRLPCFWPTSHGSQISSSTNHPISQAPIPQPISGNLSTVKLTRDANRPANQVGKLHILISFPPFLHTNLLVSSPAL